MHSAFKKSCLPNIQKYYKIEQGRKVQKKTKAIVEFELNRVCLYSHKSLTGGDGVPIYVVHAESLNGQCRN